jgi:hypothetical protein
MSETEALDTLFHWIQAGHDVATILNHFRFGKLLLQLRLVPETRSRYVFPYNADIPVLLKQDDNPYFNSHVYELTSPQQGSSIGQQTITEFRTKLLFEAISRC